MPQRANPFADLEVARAARAKEKEKEQQPVLTASAENAKEPVEEESTPKPKISRGRKQETDEESAIPVVRVAPIPVPDNKVRHVSYRLCMNVPADLMDAVEDIVYYVPGITTKTQLITAAIEEYIEALLKANGGPFPKRPIAGQ